MKWFSDYVFFTLLGYNCSGNNLSIRNMHCDPYYQKREHHARAIYKYFSSKSKRNKLSHKIGYQLPFDNSDLLIMHQSD